MSSIATCRGTRPWRAYRPSAATISPHAATFAALMWWTEHGEGTSALAATHAALGALEPAQKR